MQTHRSEDDLVQRLAEISEERIEPLNPTLMSISSEMETLTEALRVPPKPIPFVEEPELSRALRKAAELSLGATTVGTAIEPSSVANPLLAQPSLMGHYHLLEQLGAGGMGTVYRAVHSKMKRTVALKVLSANRFQSADAVSRFEREIHAAGMLQHPNIVATYDAGEVDGRHFLVMELVEGIDVGQLLKRMGPLPIAEACEIIRQTALGLQHVSDHGLVHRDLKPSNLMLALPRKGTPTVKILDLGLARLEPAHLDGAQELTSTGQVMGTIDYMAPEQGLDTHGVDIRADLYSLGATFYKLLSGRAPFEDPQYNSVMKRLIALDRDQPPPLSTLRPDCPAALCELVHRLLSKLPQDRPDQPQTVADLIAPFANGADLSNLRHGNIPSTSSQRADQQPVIGRIDSNPSPVAFDQFPPKRRNWWLAAASFCFALLLGVTIFVVTDNGHVRIEAPGDLKDTVTVSVLRNGAVVDNDWRIVPGQNNHRIQTGTVEVKLPAGMDDAFELRSTTDLIVKRGGEVKYRLTRRKPDLAQPMTPAVPGTTTDQQNLAVNAPAPATAPFDAAQARKHQDEWAAYLKVPVEYTNKVGMQFRLIPPGKYVRGSTESEIAEGRKFLGEGGEQFFRDWLESEGPQHLVEITQPFYLGMHEVTQRQYVSVTGQNPAHFSVNGKGRDTVAGQSTDNLPVESVSWNDAVDFCIRLSEAEKRDPYYFRGATTVTLLGGASYRLPTEAQWEFACRAGTVTSFWNGDDPDRSLQTDWMQPNSGQHTHPVGQLSGHPFGLHDLHGNLFEWVQDSWDRRSYDAFRNQAAVDPVNLNLSKEAKVIRGGNWDLGMMHSRSATRWAGSCDRGTPFNGFRVALSIEALKQNPSGDGHPRSSPTVDLAEPPPLEEWLKGRTVLTVAQDDSGQFKTIQAALHALQPGQVVKVLDRGPYRESLEMQDLPADTGLVSDVDTVIEAANWKPYWTSRELSQLHVAGHYLFYVNGFRWSGFTLLFPNKNLPMSDGMEVFPEGVTVERGDGFVMENCWVQSGPKFAAVICFREGDIQRPACLRECRFDEEVAFSPGTSRGGEVLIVRNWFEGTSRGGRLAFGRGELSRIAVRNNIMEGGSGSCLIATQKLAELEISNNLMNSDTAISFLDFLPNGQVSIVNNLRSSAGFLTVINVPRNQLAATIPNWYRAGNCYLRDIGSAENSQQVFVAKATDDRLGVPRFLSKTPSDRNYLRLEADDSGSHSQAGDRWPNYVGAFSAGPAPKEGDWFIRLRKRRGDLSPANASLDQPTNIDEPPPLEEWLKGRTALTVAQDGSGQFKTIQSALDALRPGQVVKVLDAGPYHERIVASGLPKNTGLISEVRTVIEVSEWPIASHLHLLRHATDFRLHGFRFRVRPRDEWFEILAVDRASGLVIENCAFGLFGLLEQKARHSGVNLATDPNERAQPLWIRECVFEGVPITLGYKALVNATIIVERNFFSRASLTVGVDAELQTLIIRHNVFDTPDRNFLWFEELHNVRENLSILNNTATLAETDVPIGIAFVKDAPIGNVTVRNNLSPNNVGVNAGTVKNREAAIANWTMSHNGYVRMWGADSTPRLRSDVVAPYSFLSIDPTSPNAWRFKTDSEQATAGAGGDLPNYLGALPPGEAPPKGDWFTRLQTRWLTR